MLKRRDVRYVSGARSTEWRNVKLRRGAPTMARVDYRSAPVGFRGAGVSRRVGDALGGGDDDYQRQRQENAAQHCPPPYDSVRTSHALQFPQDVIAARDVVGPLGPVEIASIEPVIRVRKPAGIHERTLRAPRAPSLSALGQLRLARL